MLVVTDADKELISPTGYGFFEVEGHSMVGNKSNEYYLSNRSFNEVNTYFSEEISRAINELLSNHPERKICILDLAGGGESRAIKDIGKRWGNRVNAINADLIHKISDKDKPVRIQADATLIPLGSSSVDIIYCRQFLPFLNRFSRDHRPQVETVLSEVSRILKSGGVAFLDDEEEISGSKSEARRQELAGKLGVMLDTRDSQLIKEETGISRFWHKNPRMERFLLMKKSIA